MLGVGRGGPLLRAEPVVAGGASPSRVGPGAVQVEERDAWVVLVGVPGVGPVSFARLVAALGDARSVLRESCSPGGPARLVTASAGLDGEAATLSPSAAWAVADAAMRPAEHLEPVRRAGLRVLTLADDDYPSRLRRIELPPPVLFVRGSFAALDARRAVAVVGTRRPTAIGRATASRIADAIAGLGATVVSGLALGVDAAAHAAAVRASGTTVAVIGGGHERLYPAANRGLARAIVDRGGAVISEFPPLTAPSRGTFPRRNRIISGLSDATVVVEAGARSGALTTAAWALEQGRGLHIVPGRLDDPAVAGCLAFLREAGPEARIVVGVAELVEDLGLLELVGVDAAAGEAGPGRRGARGPSPAAILATLPAVERALLLEVVAGRGSVDELVAATGLTAAGVLGALTALEIRGLVVEGFGRYRPSGPIARAGARRGSRDRAA